MIRKFNEHIAYLNDDYDPDEILELVGLPSGNYFKIKRKEHNKLQQLINWSEKLQMYVYRDKDYTKILFLLDNKNLSSANQNWEEEKSRFNKKKIKDIMDIFKIKEYFIGNGDTVTINQDINMKYNTFTKFPIKLLTVNGNVSITNSALESLDNFPSKIIGDLDIKFNRLKNLKDGPKSVSGVYDCSYNLLVSLQGAPSELESFNCSHNNLTNLKYGPLYVDNIYDCSYNQISNLIDSPIKAKTFNCQKNPIVNFKGIPNADFIIK